jgi:hypothetical protein
VSQLAVFSSGVPEPTSANAMLTSSLLPAERDLLLFRQSGHKRGIAFIVCLADRRHEAQAFAGAGADQALGLAVVAHGLADSIDAAVERGIRYDSPAPNGGDEIVLAHHPLAVLHKIEQQIKDLRLKGDKLGIPPQLAPACIKYMIFKVKLHRNRPGWGLFGR